jgi:hypothetical protein
VELLLLSMTNRLGRIVDRSRQLARQLCGAPPGERATDFARIDILWRRARIVWAAIAFAVVSMLLAVVLIIAPLIMALLALGVGWPVSSLVVACMGCVIASVMFFIWDVNLSLNALNLDVEFFEHDEER